MVISKTHIFLESCGQQMWIRLLQGVGAPDLEVPSCPPVSCHYADSGDGVETLRHGLSKLVPYLGHAVGASGTWFLSVGMERRMVCS